MTDEHHADRRSFLRTGAIAGTALVAGAALAQIAQLPALVSPVTKGDIAILRFLSAVEQIESDLWQQYNELGGIQDSEEPDGSGNPAYTAALKEPRWGHGSVYPRQHRRRVQPPRLPQRLSWVRLAHSQLTWINFATLKGSTGDRGQQAKLGTAHQSHAAHRRYQLVDAVSQPRP